MNNFYFTNNYNDLLIILAQVILYVVLINGNHDIDIMKPNINDNHDQWYNEFKYK